MHEDLRESFSFLRERTQYLRVAIDGLNIFMLSDVYQMNMYVCPILFETLKVLASQPGMYFSQVNCVSARF